MPPPNGSGECLHILAASPLAAGQEVFNTYGELGNAELVAKYGFCLDSNPFSEVQLDKAVVLAAVQEVLLSSLVSARARLKVIKRLAARRRLMEETSQSFVKQPGQWHLPCLQ
ncbi:uncharacterized protein HaLaN_16170 [Haematococcus lacustris]|uniref:SET domain-containing protein n=1 Tax=Haematococcus lacustris TaxID=44745 RepID=A0A699ZTE2_HAELA|nr:uncharacterized protein HaLaN_16170 [Haematococcus lacustris]